MVGISMARSQELGYTYCMATAKQDLKAYRTLAKNWHTFFNLLFTNKAFADAVLALWEKWNSPASLSYFSDCKSYEEVKRRNAAAHAQRIKFLNALGSEKKNELVRDMQEVLLIADFGDEWKGTIADFLISGWFSPPIYNMSIAEVGGVGKKRIQLTLNPDTSIEGIKEAWRFIDKKQHELRPDFRHSNFSTKTFRNLLRIMHLAMRRIDEDEKMSRRQSKTAIPSSYEDLVEKQYGGQGLKHMKGERKWAGEKASLDPKPPRRITDLALISEMLHKEGASSDGKTSRRMAVTLRKAKQRLREEA
jgi:hypothetical protein